MQDGCLTQDGGKEGWGDGGGREHNEGENDSIYKHYSRHVNDDKLVKLRLSVSSY